MWGTNDELFDRLTAVRVFAEELLAELGDEARTRWLIPPDATALRGLVAWTQHADSLGADALDPTPVRHNGYFHRLEGVAAGEGRVYVVAAETAGCPR